jgi:hypothetical protein
MRHCFHFIIPLTSLKLKPAGVLSCKCTPPRLISNQFTDGQCSAKYSACEYFLFPEELYADQGETDTQIIVMKVTDQ